MNLKISKTKPEPAIEVNVEVMERGPLEDYLASNPEAAKLHAGRLIELREALEAYLDGYLLIFNHGDVPGVIGSVGTIFGKHGVNIGQMSVGRASDKPGGSAIGVLYLDSQPPQAAIDEVAAHPHVQRVKIIQLPNAGQMPPWMQG